MIARTTRAAGVLALGALALHQLRYLLAYGGDAGRALSAQGHGYLTTLAPLLVALAVAVALAAVVLPALAGDDRARPAPRFARRCAAYAAALLAVFWVQEVAEALLAGGHPDGLAAIFGGGGWLAAPLAIGHGALAAAVAAVLDRAEDGLACAIAGLRDRLPRAPRAIGIPPAGPVHRLTLSPLAFGIARRPPPRHAI